MLQSDPGSGRFTGHAHTTGQANTIERPLGIERQQITIENEIAYELKELLRLCGLWGPCIWDLSVADI